MYKTDSGNLVAEDKEEAITVMQTLADAGKLSVKDIRSSQYSMQTLKKFFDGIPEVKDTIYGEDRTEIVNCPDCGRTLSSERGMKVHRSRLH